MGGSWSGDDAWWLGEGERQKRRQEKERERRRNAGLPPIVYEGPQLDFWDLAGPPPGPPSWGGTSGRPYNNDPDDYWRKPSWGYGGEYNRPPADPYGQPFNYLNYFDPVILRIYQTVNTLTRTFLPDVGAWVDENIQGVRGPQPIWQGGLFFQQKRSVPNINLSPLPIPQFDSGLSLPRFSDNTPRILIGELTFATLSKNAIQISAKEFVMDVKPVEWQMIEALYDIKIYSSDEWRYAANMNYPGWRAKIYNGVYDQHSREIAANWTYRRKRRIG